VVQPRFSGKHGVPLALLLASAGCTASAQVRGGARAEGEASGGAGNSESAPSDPPRVPADPPGAASSSVVASATETSCSGNGSLRLRGQRITTTVRASGNCSVDLVDCTLEADPAIEASGNARVEVTRGSVGRGGVAVIATGNAHVELHGASVNGAVSKSGNAAVDQS
jgi:hypothetical protein